MAKKDAYYFSHDANSQDDPKCMLLIDQLGMEGYGIFWALIEKLRSESDYKLPLSIIPSMAKRWSTSSEKVATVVNNYGLFVVEDDLFFSIRLTRSMLEKSERARQSVNYRWGNDTNVIRPNTNEYERNTTDIRNDTIKGKEKKEKESKEERKRKFGETLVPFVSKYSKGMVRSFFDYWTEPMVKGGKMRFESEKAWSLERRLATWYERDNKKVAPPIDKNPNSFFI